LIIGDYFQFQENFSRVIYLLYVALLMTLMNH